MKLRHLIGVAAATFGLALAAQAAPAGPTPDGTALAWTHNGVTLAGRNGGSGALQRQRKLQRQCGGYSGPHIYNGSGSYSSKHIYNGSGSYSSKHIYNAQLKAHLQRQWKLPHLWRLRASRWLAPSPGVLARPRLGHCYGYGTDESCFAECLTSGYSPAYCTANSWQFCW